MNQDQTPELDRIAHTLVHDILEPLKSAFVGKGEIIDLLGITLVAGENLFILGPPGTAKSAIVRELGERLGGTTFEYLLTRFTEPGELFGPFDIRKLREGTLEANTEGMLPEASFVFLDELLNANSAILNSLLNVLHERVMRRGKEVRKLPLLCAIGASNHLPEDEALGALFDRFLLRVHCDNVDEDRLDEVMRAGWNLELKQHDTRPAMLSIDEVRLLHRAMAEVDLSSIREPLVQLVRRLRQAGLPLSDRRAVKVQRLIAASALLCGRLTANPSDLWVLRHVWDTQEQVEMLRSLVDDFIKQHQPDDAETTHPGAAAEGTPDPENLAQLLTQLGEELADGRAEAEPAAWKDRLTAISARCEWVTSDTARNHLKEQAASIWAAQTSEPPTA